MDEDVAAAVVHQKQVFMADQHGVRRDATAQDIRLADALNRELRGVAAAGAPEEVMVITLRHVRDFAKGDGTQLSGPR
jgi:hypothetical protein